MNNLEMSDFFIIFVVRKQQRYVINHSCHNSNNNRSSYNPSYNMESYCIFSESYHSKYFFSYQIHYCLYYIVFGVCVSVTSLNSYLFL